MSTLSNVIQFLCQAPPVMFAIILLSLKQMIECNGRYLWLTTIVKTELNPKGKIHFSQLPQEYIVKNFTVFSFHENFPQNIAEFYDEKDQKNTNITTFAFTTSWNMDQQFYHLQNIYFSQTNLFMTDNNIGYFLETRCEFKLCKRKLDNVYEHCIAVIGPWSDCYGDYLTGTLIRLTLIPKEYFPISVTLSPCKSLEHLLIELLKVLDINNYTLARPPHWYGGKMIFCKNLYTVFYNNWMGRRTMDYFPHLTNFGKLMVNFADLFIKYFNLEKIEPSEYTLYNRFKQTKRYVTNFDAITNALKAEHPDINFKIINGSFKTTEETARCWRSVKWNFATIGSNTLHSIFMHSKTVMCVYYLNRYDLNIPATLASRGIYFVIVSDPTLEMYAKTVELKINRILPYVNRSLEILRDGHL